MQNSTNCLKQIVGVFFALFLSGCIKDYPVTVKSVGHRVFFAVQPSAPYCLERVKVFTAEDRTRAIWLVDTSSQDRCVTQVEYGVVPHGFTQRGGMIPLMPGKLYQVSVSHPGSLGITFFEITSNGVIEREPPA